MLLKELIESDDRYKEYDLYEYNDFYDEWSGQSYTEDIWLGPTTAGMFCEDDEILIDSVYEYCQDREVLIIYDEYKQIFLAE